MKHLLVFVLLLIIMMSTLYNNFEDDDEMHSHEEFFSEVRAFMKKGGRFTADDGRALEQRIERLEKNSGHNAPNDG